MSGYKDPNLQDRLALAQKAREQALKKLADAPRPDEATIAKRKAAQEAREAAIAEKSAAKREVRTLRSRPKATRYPH